MRLAELRGEARGRRDFAEADRLRDKILGWGWQVLDRPEGFELTSVRRRPPVMVIADLHSWPEDGDRFIGSLGRHAAEGSFEIAEVVPTSGFAGDRNAVLAQVDTDVVVFADTSLEATGDLLDALLAALTDPSIAVAGPYGLVSTDLHDYQERTGGDVVAIQGYCLAARRDDLVAVGGFRESFTFYRNADIDLSLRLRTAGPSLRRAVAVGADLCLRHTHRAWEETPPDERDRLSRRNMRRILDRFAGRAAELTVP